MSAFRKRPAAYQMFGTELSRRGQIAEMGGKTRLDMAAKAYHVPFTAALVAFVRGSDDWEGEYHHVARPGNPHYAMPFGSAEEWATILPAWRETNAVPPVLKRAAVKARALGMKATIARRPEDAARGGFKGFLLVQSAVATYYVDADGKVTGGLSSQPEAKEQLRAALFGSGSSAQNPTTRFPMSHPRINPKPTLTAAERGWRKAVRTAEEALSVLTDAPRFSRPVDGSELRLVRHAIEQAERYAAAMAVQPGGATANTAEKLQELRRALEIPQQRFLQTVPRRPQQNPKSRSTRDKAILLHRWMDRQEAREGAYDAKHAYKHKAGTPEHAAYIAESARKRRVAHAARLKVAALNQELGQGMSETTRMVRGLGHSVAEHRCHNPLRISNKRPATMSAKAINTELDALEAAGTRFMHEAIAAGRGHERPSDRVHMTDPLSMAVKATDNRMWELRREVEQRYGRWTPRLPETRMFGAREKA